MDAVDIGLEEDIAGVAADADLPVIALGHKEAGPADLKTHFTEFLISHYHEQPVFFREPLDRIQVCFHLIYFNPFFKKKRRGRGGRKEVKRWIAKGRKEEGATERRIKSWKYSFWVGVRIWMTFLVEY